MKTNYFITGGFGFIGSKLIEKIDGNITVLTKKTINKVFLKNKNINVIKKDINELKESDISGSDIIYHFASTVDNYNILKNPYIDVKTNINGTINLLEACKKIKNKPKIIFPSTFFVYGNEYEKTGKSINETSNVDPLALYPITKLTCEQIIHLYSKLYDIPYIICRLTNVYGEDENWKNNRKAGLNYLLMRIVKNEQINLYNGGNFYRDYIYVDDVVNALIFLEKKGKNDLFLIGNGKKVFFKELIEYAMSYAKSGSKIKNVELPKFHKIVGINNFVANTNKINSLGWKPKVDYKTGIIRVINKYQSTIKI